MKQRIKVLRYLASTVAVSLACGLVSFAQQASGGQQPKPAAPATMEKAPLKEFPGGRVDALAAEWTRAKNWTKEYLDKMPEDGLAFKPTPEVRSFAEQMLHLASANFFYGATATGSPARRRAKDRRPVPRVVRATSSPCASTARRNRASSARERRRSLVSGFVSPMTLLRSQSLHTSNGNQLCE